MKLNIVPVGKGKTSEGSVSISTEQAKRVNLKLRGNKPITSKENDVAASVLKRLELSIVHPFLRVEKLT